MSVVPLKPATPAPAVSQDVIDELRQIADKLESGAVTMVICGYLEKDGMDGEPTYFFSKGGAQSEQVICSNVLRDRIMHRYIHGHD